MRAMMPVGLGTAGAMVRLRACVWTQLPGRMMLNRGHFLLAMAGARPGGCCRLPPCL
jgi:hypothetical protein